MRKFILAMLATAACAIPLSLGGCAILGGANQAASAAIQGGIELVTSLYIQHKGGNTPAGETAVAQQLTDICTQLQGVVSGNLTVAQFNAQMQTYIAKIADPTKRILATELLLQLDFYFQTVLAGQSTLLTASTQAAVTIVLTDIKAAAAFYLTAPQIRALKLG